MQYVVDSKTHYASVCMWVLIKLNLYLRIIHFVQRCLVLVNIFYFIIIYFLLCTFFHWAAIDFNKHYNLWETLRPYRFLLYLWHGCVLLAHTQEHHQFSCMYSYILFFHHAWVDIAKHNFVIIFQNFADLIKKPFILSIEPRPEGTRSIAAITIINCRNIDNNNELNCNNTFGIILIKKV